MTTTMGAAVEKVEEVGVEDEEKRLWVGDVDWSSCTLLAVEVVEVEVEGW
jgi:hypothetical protein